MDTNRLRKQALQYKYVDKICKEDGHNQTIKTHTKMSIKLAIFYTEDGHKQTTNTSTTI